MRRMSHDLFGMNKAAIEDDENEGNSGFNNVSRIL
jgi:hypothetical protein